MCGPFLKSFPENLLGTTIPSLSLICASFFDLDEGFLVHDIPFGINLFVFMKVPCCYMYVVMQTGMRVKFPSFTSILELKLIGLHR